MDFEGTRPTGATAVARLWPSIPARAALSFGTSSRELLFADADGTLCAFDVERRSVAPVPTDPAVQRWLRAHSPSAMACSLDGSTWVFEASPGVLVARADASGARTLLLEASEQSWLRIVGLTPDGTRLLAVAPQGTPRLCLYDTTDGKVLDELPARAGAISRCGRFVAGACLHPSGVVEVRVLDEGRLVATAERPCAPQALVFAADPRFVWGYGGGDLFFLDVAQDRAVSIACPCPPERVRALLPRADGAGAWLELYPGCVTSSTPAVVLHAVSPADEEAVVTPTQSRVLARPVMSPDGRAAALVGWASEPCIVDTATGGIVASPPRLTTPFSYVFSPSPMVVAPQKERVFVALGRDVYALDAQSLAVQWRRDAARAVVGATLSADEDLLFLVDDGGELLAWATEDGIERWRLKVARESSEETFAGDLSASSCGRWIVLATTRWRSHLVDVGARKVRRRFRGRATFVDTPAGPRVLSLDREADYRNHIRPPRLLVREFDPTAGLAGVRPERWRPAGVDFDDDLYVLVASPSGRYVVGRTGEDPIDFIVDRNVPFTRSFGGSMGIVLGRAQLRDDVFVALGMRYTWMAGEEMLTFLSFRLPVGADDRPGRISVVAVEVPVAVALAPCVAFVLDERGAVARYEYEPPTLDAAT